MRTLALIFVIFFANACGDNNVHKTDLLAWDYALYKGTAIWELAEATEDNDYKEMEKLVKEKNLDVNLPDPKFGQPFIFLTIWNKQFEACEKLLILGANPNLHQKGDNETALILAANEQDSNISVKILNLLLKYGADVNDVQSDSSGLNHLDSNTLPINKTALIAASGDVASNKNPLVKVKLLVEAGANVNYIGNYNASALKEALYHDNYDVALYLLEKGADYNQMLWSQDKYDENKPTYILDFLRQQVYDFNSFEYVYKMKVVAFLKSKGLDYWSHPIHPRMIEEIKRNYSKNWEDYLKKY